MNFFQGPFYSADGTEDHGGDDDVDAVVDKHYAPLFGVRACMLISF